MRVASSRYRAFAVGKALRRKGWKAGLTSSLMLSKNNYMMRLLLTIADIFLIIRLRPKILLAQRCDRRRENIWLIKMSRSLFKSKLIYDSDDPVQENNPSTNWLLNNADWLTVGSHYLNNKYKKPIIWLPTPVDMDVYKLIKKSLSNKKKILGWIGTAP